MMWSSKSFGSKFKYGFFQALIRLGLAGFASSIIFPIPLYYALKPESRKRALPYLSRRFPAAGPFRQFLNTFSLYRNFAQILFDRLLAGNGASLPVIHDPSSVRMVKEALKKGRGAVLVSAHFGCWQTGLLALGKTGARVSVVFWQEERLEHDYFHYDRDVEIISANGGLASVFQMRNALRDNRVLCFMGDRITPGDRKCAGASFLGGKIRLPLFPYLLAKSMGAPVIFAASVRRENAVMGLPAFMCKDGAQAPQAFAAFLEKLVQDYPRDFFNFYDMWDADDQR